MKKAGILQIIPALETGGVERGVVDLCLYAKQRGYDIMVASSGGKLVKKLLDADVKHFQLDLKTKNPIKIIKNAFAIAKLARKYNIGVLHGRSRAPAWSAYLASFLCRADFVTTYHGLYKENAPLKRFYNSVMTRGKFVIAVSEFCKKHILKRYPEINEQKIHVIHRGVDPKEFNKAKITPEIIHAFRQKIGVKDDVILLFLPGRVTRWKGQDVLLKAMLYLKTENVVALVAGSHAGHDNYHNEIKNFVREKNLQKQVILSGNISDMAIAYGACDIVINSSIEPETFGRTIAEANLMGKPVIASNIGGAKEIIINDLTGKLFENKNHLDLAEKIKSYLEILKDEQKKQEVSEACTKNVFDNFLVSNMGEKTLKLYNSL
jgi:glycosyltransferase involved in cell wall biosynthesis